MIEKEEMKKKIHLSQLIENEKLKGYNNYNYYEKVQ